ncbi:transcription elongation factor spt4 [Sorochytrium milnesiophthora]
MAPCKRSISDLSVQNQSQFKRDGCDNCEEILKMRGSSDRVLECTSQSYDGVIALMNPDRSWCAKWQRIEPYVKGLYAIRVVGRVPDDVEAALERRNIRYRPRDGSVRD